MQVRYTVDGTALIVTLLNIVQLTAVQTTHRNIGVSDLWGLAALL